MARVDQSKPCVSAEETAATRPDSIPPLLAPPWRLATRHQNDDHGLPIRDTC